MLVPNCVYRCGCPEFNSCGFWDKYLRELEEYLHYDTAVVFYKIQDINQRYRFYNDNFYKMSRD